MTPPTDSEVEKALARADYCASKGHCNHREEDSQVYEWLNAKALCDLSSAYLASQEQLLQAHNAEQKGWEKCKLAITTFFRMKAATMGDERLSKVCNAWADMIGDIKYE